MKKTNNKGFNLVELIIVIAIMVILVAVIAPQYLKYVNNSKIGVDVQTAAELASAFNIAIADGTLTADSSTTTTSVPSGVTNVSAMPISRTFATPEWSVTYDGTNGVTKITLKNNAAGAADTTAYEVYPNPDRATGVTYSGSNATNCGVNVLDNASPAGLRKH